MDSLGISGSSVLFSKLFTANPHDLSQRTEFPNLIWICSHVKNVNKMDLHFRHQYISMDNPEIVFYSWLVQGAVILYSSENGRTCAGWKCTKNIICRNLKPSSFSGKKILTYLLPTVSFCFQRLFLILDAIAIEGLHLNSDFDLASSSEFCPLCYVRTLWCLSSCSSLIWDFS